MRASFPLLGRVRKTGRPVGCRMASGYATRGSGISTRGKNNVRQPWACLHNFVCTPIRCAPASDLEDGTWPWDAARPHAIVRYTKREQLLTQLMHNKIVINYLISEKDYCMSRELRERPACVRKLGSTILTENSAINWQIIHSAINAINSVSSRCSRELFFFGNKI